MFRIPWILVLFLITVRAESEKTQGNFLKDEPDELARPAVRSVQRGLQDKGNYAHVRCYSCSDCQTVTYNTTVKTCPYSSNNLKRHKCVSFVERYKYLDKPWYVRGCASERGNCAEIQRAHDETGGVMELSSCNDCEGDKCNGGSRSLTGFLSLVVTPILAKLALS